MRKIIKILSSKKVMGILLLALQLGLFYLGFYALREYSWYIFGGEKIIGAFVILLIINRDTDSGFKISWIFLIAVVTLFGVCLYFYVRLDIPSSKIKSELRTIYDSTADLTKSDDYELTRLSSENCSDIGIFNYLYNHAGYPPYSNTFAKYLPLGDEAFPVILESLKKATKFIFIEFFIINDKSRVWQEIYRVLCEKIHEGVDVRVMYDGMGSMLTVSPGFGEKLRSLGADIIKIQ